MAIISPLSSILIYSSSAHCAFEFLHMPPACVVGFLFPPSSCVLGFEVVSYAPSVCLCCSLVGCVFSFFPFWVPIFFVPSFVYFVLPWPILNHLGTWSSEGCISLCFASPSVVLSDTSWVMVGIFHSLEHSLMTILISPSMM
jgi:hypothetical protein